MGKHFQVTLQERDPSDKGKATKPTRNMFRKTTLAVLAVVCLQAYVKAEEEVKEPDCPVCHNVIKTFSEALTKEEKKDIVKIEEKFQAFCDKKANENSKDAKFCYYTTGASSLKREISKPLSWVPSGGRLQEAWQ